VALVTLYLFAHQPHRLRDYPERRRMDEQSPQALYDHLYEEWFNEEVFRRVARECYWPATTLLLHLVQEQSQRRKPFKLNFALSGLFIEQARRWEPQLLDVFRQLAATGLVEFTGETFYHSLSSLCTRRRSGNSPGGGRRSFATRSASTTTISRRRFEGWASGAS